MSQCVSLTTGSKLWSLESRLFQFEFYYFYLEHALKWRQVGDVVTSWYFVPSWISNDLHALGSECCNPDLISSSPGYFCVMLQCFLCHVDGVSVAEETVDTFWNELTVFGIITLNQGHRADCQVGCVVAVYWVVRQWPKTPPSCFYITVKLV